MTLEYEIPILHRVWTPDAIAAHEAFYGPKPLTDLIRELVPPLTRLDSGVLYRDRRVSSPVSAAIP